MTNQPPPPPPPGFGYPPPVPPAGGLSKRAKRWIIVAVVLGALMLIGALGNENERDSDTHAYEPAVDTGGSDVDDLFVQVVHQQAPDTVAVPDATLIDAAHAACEALDGGATMTMLYATAVSEGVSAEVGGAIVGAGVTAYCPEHADELDLP